LEEVGHWGNIFEVYPVPNPFPSPFLLPAHHEVSSFVLPLMCCLTTGPQTTEPGDHGQKSLEL
jgi:hypothetical protein